MKHPKSLWKRLRYKIARSLYALREEPLPTAIEAIARKERLPNEARLLSMYRIGEAEGEKKGYQRAIEETTIKRLQAVVYIDPRVRAAAYEQPGPTTDPALLSRIQERKRQEALQSDILAEQQRREKMKAFLHCDSVELPKVTGDLTRKWQTGKLQGL